MNIIDCAAEINTGARVFCPSCASGKIGPEAPGAEWQNKQSRRSLLRFALRSYASRAFEDTRKSKIKRIAVVRGADWRGHGQRGGQRDGQRGREGRVSSEAAAQIRVWVRARVCVEAAFTLANRYPSSARAPAFGWLGTYH
jgi:hypothetical protein